MSSSKMTGLCGLPTELIIELCTYLDYESLRIGLRNTCRHFCQILNDSSFEFLLRHTLMRRNIYADRPHTDKAANQAADCLLFHPCLKRLKYVLKSDGTVDRIGFYHNKSGIFSPFSSDAFDSLRQEDAFCYADEQKSVTDMKTFPEVPFAIFAKPLRQTGTAWVLCATVGEFVEEIKRHINGLSHRYRPMNLDIKPDPLPLLDQPVNAAWGSHIASACILYHSHWTNEASTLDFAEIEMLFVATRVQPWAGAPTGVRAYQHTWTEPYRDPIDAALERRIYIRADPPRHPLADWEFT